MAEQLLLDQLGELERTCYCGQVTEDKVGETVTLAGWVETRRDLGNLIFLDLRDREGIVQCVASPGRPGVLKKAKKVRSEFVVGVEGKVVRRGEDVVNPSLKTGMVEVQIDHLHVFNTSLPLPFPISEATSAIEETRLRYRFLDLRRGSMQRNLRLRHEAALATRRILDSLGFLEIETPILTRSTPEGARDYLVPSRVHAGQFYALPQSPQIFKQILMISGFDKYFQIVKCFRDEDLRADRQPEFTQIDIEMSYPRPETVFKVVEQMLVEIFKVIGAEPELPFPRMSYDEAMSRFGTDRPDTRFGLELTDMGAVFEETPFNVFRTILQGGGMVKGIRVPGKADYSRKDLDLLGEVVGRYGAKGLAWIKKLEDGFKSSLPKVVPEPELSAACDEAGLEAGDILLMVAGTSKVVHGSLAALRLHLGQQLDLIDGERWDFLWVYDFPLFEWDEETKRYYAMHHPFTSPKPEDLDKLESDRGAVRSQGYDVVLNGLEIGGGSIRIHQEEVQKRVFHALNIGEEEAEERFGFLLEALRYGAPPHGGIAMGLDRIVMLLAGASSIREVMAFPKTARGVDLMCQAPSEVDPKQLDELHIEIKDRDLE
ncbi:MAG TPA: aspartate--tRNA ligase [Acidobacteriota bacterium]|nr:aspartate--tRNA ligase [Acidobacteriota bacterium]